MAIPIYSAVQDYPSTASSNTIAYGLENPLIGNIPVNNITEMFFTEELQRVYDKQTKNVTAEFRLPEGEYIDFKLNDRIVVQGIRYIVTELTMDLITGVAKATIQTYNDPSRYKPVSATKTTITYNEEPTENVVRSYYSKEQATPSTTYDRFGSRDFIYKQKLSSAIFGVVNTGGIEKNIADCYGNMSLTLTANTYQKLEIGQTVFQNTGFTITTSAITPNSRSSFNIVFNITGTAPAYTNYTIKINGKEYLMPVANGEDFDETFALDKIINSGDDIEIYIKADNSQSVSVEFNTIVQ